MGQIALDYEWLEEYFEKEIRRLTKIAEGYERTKGIAEAEIQTAKTYDVPDLLKRATKSLTEVSIKLDHINPKLLKMNEQYQILLRLQAKK